MKSKLQFPRIIGYFALLTIGILALIQTDLFSTGVIELLEIAEAFKDHSNMNYTCSGQHPQGCCSICLMKG